MWVRVRKNTFGLRFYACEQAPHSPALQEPTTCNDPIIVTLKCPLLLKERTKSTTIFNGFTSQSKGEVLKKSVGFIFFING